MFCTSKEQETCDVEKQGCEGCYYNKEVPTPDNPIPIEKQAEYYYDTGEKMLIKGYKDMELTKDEMKMIEAYRLVKKYAGGKTEDIIIANAKTFYAPDAVILSKDRIRKFQENNCPKICECGICEELLGV